MAAGGVDYTDKKMKLVVIVRITIARINGRRIPLMPPKPQSMEINMGIQLQIKKLVVDKEWIIACANRDITQFGQWSCNWNEPISAIDQQLEKLISDQND